MSTRDFLVELGTEELPPLAMPDLERAFADGVRKGLSDAGLAFGSLHSFAAPRRLAVLVNALAEQQPEQEIRRRGPPVNAAFDKAGQPMRAGTAFAESCGVAIDTLQRVQEGKGEFLYFTGRKQGAAAVALLPGIVQASLDALPIPRRMRWGASDAEFVRPVHWLVMLFGGDVVPARLLDTDAGRATRGHRFHAPAPLPLAAPAEYPGTLRSKGMVLADFTERRERVRTQVMAKAAELAAAAAQTAGNWRALISDELLEEVTALVEWPVAVAGRFEDRFLTLPREVLISTLQEHQRYFPVEDSHGHLVPWFITASNIESRDPQRVREGNERVVRPRLSDAAFFYEQDRKLPLAARRAGLNDVTFQTKLGSLGDKTRRVQRLAEEIAGLIGGVPMLAREAAELCKCDLLSAMVGEFPDLQGIMGAYYATADGMPLEVATAIREHYLPRSSGDDLPQTHTGMAVALGDRLDTLAGIFAIGQKPSGTKDPFGLRRAAIGVLRIVLEHKLDFDLAALIAHAVALQPLAREGTTTEVFAYILERLRGHYVEGRSGVAADGQVVVISTEMFDAVTAAHPVSLVDIDMRLRALAAFLARPEAVSLTAANKRISNILRKSAEPIHGMVDSHKFTAPAEKALGHALTAHRDAVLQMIAARDYSAAFNELAALRPHIDGFFDDVMVNDPNPLLRANRLSLLGQLHGLFAGIADLSRLPG